MQDVASTLSTSRQPSLDPTTQSIPMKTTAARRRATVSSAATQEVFEPLPSSTPGSRPLTTVFTRPSWCSNVQYVHDHRIATPETYLQGWFLSSLESSATPCFPSNYYGFNQVNWHYSPGVCPAGYTAAASTTSHEQHWSWCCPRYVMTSPGGIRSVV